MKNIKIPVGTKLYFRSKSGEILNITTQKTYEGSVDENRLNDSIFGGGYIVNIKPSISIKEDGVKDYRKTVFIMKVDDFMGITNGGSDVSGLNVTKTSEDGSKKVNILMTKETTILGTTVKEGDIVIINSTCLPFVGEENYILLNNKGKTVDLTKVEFAKFGTFRPLVNKDVVTIRYKGENELRRVLITNILYETRMIEVFQVEGYSNSGKSKGIKNMYIDEVELIK